MNIGDLALARLSASARIRNALRIVDLPALFGPTRILKFSRETEKSRKALYRENLTDVIRNWLLNMDLIYYHKIGLCGDRA